MPIDLMDVIARRTYRQQTPFAPTEGPLDDEAEYQDLVAYTERMRPIIDAQEQPEQPLAAPGNIFGRTLGAAQTAIESATPLVQPLLERLGRAEITAAQQQAEQAPAITGLGETALGVVSGAVGGTVGGIHFAEQAIRDIGEPSSPDYWKNLVAKSQEIGARFTYAPRTEAGQQITQSVMDPAMQAIHEFSKRASDTYHMRYHFNEDQRHAIAYAHELVTMMAAGQLGGAGVAKLRSSRAKFQNEFSRATREGGNESTLVESAQRVIDAAERQPEWSERVAKLRELQARDVQQARDAAMSPLDDWIAEQARLRQQPEAVAPSAAPAPAPSAGRPEYIQNALDNAKQTTDALGITEDIIRLAREGKTAAEIATELRSRVPSTIANVDLRNTIRAVRTRENIPSMDEVRGGEGVLPPSAGATAPGTGAIAVGEIKGMLGGMGKGIADNLYISMWERMEQGKLPDPFPVHQQTAFGRRALNEYKQGNVKGWEDLKRMANTGVPEVPTHIPAIQDVLAPVEQLPSRPGRERAYRRERYSPITPEERINYERGLQALESPAQGASTLSAAKKVAIAKEKSEVFSSRPEVMDAIQAAIEAGNRDAGAELARQVPGLVKSEFAKMKFEEAFDLAHRGRKSSSKRGVMDIINDLADLFAFDVDPTSLGANFGNVRLSHRQKMAAQRLMADAQKAGRSLDDYLQEKGLSEKTRFLYSSYLQEIKAPVPPAQVGPKDMALDPYAMTSDPVSQRATKDNGRLGPPIFSSEARAFLDAPVRPPKSDWSWQTAPRTAKQFSQEIHDMTVVPARSAKHSSDLEIAAMRKDLSNLFTGVNRQSKNNIANYALDLVEGGDRFLAERNRVAKPLSPKEREVLQNIEGGITNLLERIDEVRGVIGLDPLPPIDSPIAFMRAMVVGAKNKGRANLATTPSNIIWGRYDTDMLGPMARTATQRMLRMEGELDIAHMFDQFATSTIEHIKLAPLSAKLREFERGSIMLPERPDLPGVRLQETNPGLHDYVRRFANALEGVNEAPLGKHFGIDMDSTLRAVQENMAWALLSASVKSAIAQPTSLIWTAHNVGPKNLALGIGDALASFMRRSTAWKDLVKNSQVLSSRKDLSVYGDWAEAFARGSLRELPGALRAGRSREAVAGVAKVGMFPMQGMDQLIATISGLAFSRRGRELGLSGNRLRDYIDDGIVKTQGSGWRADVAPIQRHTLGKAVTQFQTITLSDWNFITKDVLKMGEDVPLKERALSVAGLIGVVTAYNFLTEDVLRIPSVAPKPLREAERSAARGDDPLAVAMNYIYGLAAPVTPIIGGTRYGTGIGGPVIGKATVTLPQAVLGKAGSVDPLEPLSELAGVPASGTYWRLAKDTGQTIIEKLIGEPPPARISGGGSGGLKGLKGSRGGGLKGLR